MRRYFKLSQFSLSNIHFNQKKKDISHKWLHLQAFWGLCEQVGLGQVCAIPKYELVSFFVLPNVTCSSIKMLPSCRHSVLDKAPLFFFVINNMHLAECNSSWFVYGIWTGINIVFKSHINSYCIKNFDW